MQQTDYRDQVRNPITSGKPCASCLTWIFVAVHRSLDRKRMNEWRMVKNADSSRDDGEDDVDGLPSTTQDDQDRPPQLIVTTTTPLYRLTVLALLSNPDCMAATTVPAPRSVDDRTTGKQRTHYG
ncbi:hypothetical protein RP20_CCG022923 [Aedes albopictus]|nr:hypothetical protein RP20_CCG022923 [Aedes albopictus]